ncbi:DUF6233 domain-containing protein [Streptomyces sp. NPDC056730]|uniref:DUF6233 domain-containing protein n=1 Tax=unclassified Streptomyces TaxID=2593676 RepID=UPI003691FA5D
MEGGGTAPGRRRGVVAVHQGECGMGKGPGCTRDEARRMLADGVEACPYCNPDVAPGLL